MIEALDFCLNPDETQTAFLRHTPYMPLDTISFKRDVTWNGTLYVPKRWPRYVIGRDVPGKIARELFQRDLAKPGPKLWENQEPFHYDVSNTTVGARRIFVPAFSKTDFYSIPRFFHRVYSPTDIGHKGAHVHDLLCDKHEPVRFLDRDGHDQFAVHPVDFKHAALVFYEAQRVAMVPESDARWKYRAVRAFGPRFAAGDWTPVPPACRESA